MLGAVGVGMICLQGLMFCGAVVDWVKGERGNAMGVGGFEGEEVIYWALCIVSAWIVVMLGVWVTKCVIEVMRGDEEDDEGEELGSCDVGRDDEDGEVVYKCEAERERGDGETREEESKVGEVKGDDGRKKEVRRVRAVADEGDPCMPDNREWGEW